MLLSDIRKGYDVDIDKAFNAINNIEIVKKVNISVTDDDMYYIFNFEDGTKLTFSFENKYYRYNNENHEIKNFNKVELNKNQIIEYNY